MQLIFVTVLASVLLPHYAIAQEALRDRAITDFTSKPALEWTQLTSPVDLLQKSIFAPLAPQFWGEPNSKSSTIGGFRRHSRIYATGLVIANQPPLSSTTGTPGGQRTSGGTHAELPPAPGTGTAGGQRTPGGSRGGACKQTDKPLTALVPENARGLTTAEYPIFWFYIPDAPEDIHTIEFSVHDRNETATLYRTSVQLTKTPGVVGIPLPSSPAYSLKLNESYRWRLIVNCDPNETSENMLELDGWVTRVQQSPNPWYDNLTNLAKRYLSEPQNPEVKTAWAALLKSVDLEELAQAPLVRSRH